MGTRGEASTIYTPSRPAENDSTRAALVPTGSLFSCLSVLSPEEGEKTRKMKEKVFTLPTGSDVQRQGKGRFFLVQ